MSMPATQGSMADITRGWSPGICGNEKLHAEIMKQNYLSSDAFLLFLSSASISLFCPPLLNYFLTNTPTPITERGKAHFFLLFLGLV